MDKKAQGLSLNTIIVAIIVLIVLVVLIMIFTGYFGSKFTPGVTSCENSGGICMFKTDEGRGCGYNAFGSEISPISATCPNAEEQVCCPKGLGSGTAPTVDDPDCGEEGKAPCKYTGCISPLVDDGGKCKAPAPVVPTCAAAGGTCVADAAACTGTVIDATGCVAPTPVCCGP